MSNIKNTSRNPDFHSLVWLVWLVAAVLAVSSNPLLNLLVLAQALLVALACRTDSPVGRAFRLFGWLAVVIVAVRTVLSAVPVGGITYGETPLFAIPSVQLPIWLGGLNIGGVTTLEMIANGFVLGLRLATLVLIFGAFNAVADHYGLLRRTPGALFHAALIITIALTFVPQVIVQLQVIRDAQRVRGHRFRSWRDALPLLVPLLAGGLERSIQLAEAMDSRGYGRTTVARRNRLSVQLAMIAGLTALSIGVYFVFTGEWRGGIVGAAGLAGIIMALRALGTGTPRSRYGRERWHRHDTFVVLACSLLIVATMLLRATGTGGLTYTAFPRITLPPFEPVAGLVMLLLGAPALLSLTTTEEPDERRLWHRTMARRSERRASRRTDFQGDAQPEPIGGRRAHR